MEMLVTGLVIVEVNKWGFVCVCLGEGGGLSTEVGGGFLTEVVEAGGAWAAQ